MTRRPTPSELMWPNDPEDSELPVVWAASISVQILGWTWRAFDSLRSNHLSRIDMTQPMDQIERDLTRHHFSSINTLWAQETGGFSTFSPHHEYPEMESRTSSSAKPPAYDLAFVAMDNLRWVWPLEAKVVSSSGALAEYLRDVNVKFVGGVAAPLVGEGAMIAYLLTNQASEALNQLASRLGQSLAAVTEFVDRPHRVSFHQRDRAPNLRLHHLMMDCT